MSHHAPVAAPEVSVRPTKEKVEVNGVEVNFPGKGTGARYVWDLCMHAVANGESSTFVVETAAANTTMSKPSINSQITYFRKETGLELSRRVNLAKSEEKLAKEQERADKKAAKALEKAAKAGEQIVKLKERIAKDQAKLAELLAAQEAAPADEDGEPAVEGEDDAE